jgi:Fe-Mn family superoxide dismutase
MYETKDFNHLLGLKDFSNQLLKDHFLLYQGYVVNSNKLQEELKDLEKDSLSFQELNRRIGTEYNGMVLHELYFENLTKNSKEPKNTQFWHDLKQPLLDWEENFRNVAKTRGAGWTILTYEPKSETLMNVWVTDHDKGLLVNTKPLLVLDCFEHAYLRDYGIKKDEYVDAFMKSIDWDVVAERYEGTND